MQAILTDNLAEIRRFCELFHVKKLEAFGSVLRDDFDLDQSDIDFLIEFTEAGTKNYADNYFGFLHSLEDLLHRPIELVIESSIDNPYFLESIKHDRIPIYQK